MFYNGGEEGGDEKEEEIHGIDGKDDRESNVPPHDAATEL